MKVPFVYYLHDDYNSHELVDEIRSQLSKQGVDLPESDDVLAERFGSPFYEVKLECELDTVTGEVTLLKANL